MKPKTTIGSNLRANMKPGGFIRALPRTAEKLNADRMAGEKVRERSKRHIYGGYKMPH